MTHVLLMGVLGVYAVYPSHRILTSVVENKKGIRARVITKTRILNYFICLTVFSNTIFFNQFVIKSLYTCMFVHAGVYFQKHT